MVIIGSNINNNTVREGSGGGIFINGALVMNSSNINYNYAWDAGGIYNDDGTVNLTSCNIYNNNAVLSGGGIYSSINCVLRFCRILGNSADIGANIYCSNYPSSNVDAQYNWWGSNNNPSKISGNVNVTPWLVLNLTANPSLIENGGSSDITADLLYDSNGGYHDPASGHVPNGIQVIYTTTLGIINSPIYTLNGFTTATLISGTVGVANVSTTINNQTVYTTVTIH